MNTRIMIVSVVIVLVGLYFLTRSPADLAERLLIDPILVVDVRTPEEYAAGHYPDAINVPLAELKTTLDVFKGHTGTVVAYCRTGRRSQEAYTILKEAGIPHVLNGTNAEKVSRLLAKKKH